MTGLRVNLPTFWLALPAWAVAAVAVASGVIALGVLIVAVLLPWRDRAAAGHDAADPPARLDLMLIISSLGIVGLAVAVYLTRP